MFTLLLRRFRYSFRASKGGIVCGVCASRIGGYDGASCVEIEPLVEEDVEACCKNCGCWLSPLEVELWETTAPKCYDGHGTFGVSEAEGLRVVATLPHNTNWQLGRYGSGLCVATPCHSLPDGGFSERFQKLYKQEVGR